MDAREKLACYSYQYNGDWSLIAKAIEEDQKPFFYRINEPYITIYDREYPEQLLSLRYPPWILFYRGNIELLKKEAVTVVGSRKPSLYGIEATTQCTAIISEKNLIVSGLAKGVDVIAHSTAIKHGQKTIGVVGCGLNTCYPYENLNIFNEMRANHLIISEYPCFTTVKRHHFPWRNRILAALGKVILVTEATPKSGTMCTVNEALTIGKEIWCCPSQLGNPKGEGCNLLISQGANIVYSYNLLKEI